MPSDGKKFEGLLHEIHSTLAESGRYATVERDVLLQGPDGQRQFDLVMRAKKAGVSITTAVECRDPKSKLTVTAVDGFRSRLTAANASHGVLVSSKGFTEGARQKAKRLGITLCQASNAVEVLRNLELRVPVRLLAISAAFENCEGLVHMQAGEQLDLAKLFVVNDKWIPDVFRDELMSGAFECPLETGGVHWVPVSLAAPHLIRMANGETRTLESPRFAVSVTASYFFGYLDDLPEAVATRDFSDLSTKAFLKSEDLPPIAKRLERFKSREELPGSDAVTLVAVGMPTLERAKFGVRIESPDGGAWTFEAHGKPGDWKTLP